MKPAEHSGGSSGARWWLRHAVDVDAEVWRLPEAKQLQEAPMAVERGWNGTLVLRRCSGEGLEEQRLSGARWSTTEKLADVGDEGVDSGAQNPDHRPKPKSNVMTQVATHKNQKPK